MNWKSFRRQKQLAKKYIYVYIKDLATETQRCRNTVKQHSGLISIAETHSRTGQIANPRNCHLIRLLISDYNNEAAVLFELIRHLDRVICRTRAVTFCLNSK
jgi:hypothetical protein